MKNQNKGFSLLEILVVLVLVGILVSGATVAINFGGIDKELDKTVERFVSYCAHASDTAVFDGEPVGLVLVPPSWRDDPFEQGWMYYWQKLGPQGWVEIPQLKPMELEKEFELSFMIEGQEWEPKADEIPEIFIPSIVFYPGGDLTMFEMEASHRDLDESEHVSVNDWGRVIWEEKEEIMQELEEQKK